MFSESLKYSSPLKDPSLTSLLYRGFVHEIHLFQLVHQPRQSPQGLQVSSSLVGHPDKPMEGVVHAVVKFGGRGESSPEGDTKSPK